MKRIQMVERPIIFRSEMVRSILDGRKTQTRRVLSREWGYDGTGFVEDKNGDHIEIIKVCPHGRIGDRLWVKETHWRSGYVQKWAGAEPIEPIWVDSGFDFRTGKWQKNCVFYDHPRTITKLCDFRRKVPSIFMPRWASRILLEITNVRVERIQDISEEDAKAEGIKLMGAKLSVNGKWVDYTHKTHFEDLWNSLHENRGFGWNKNPWVWVIEFKKMNVRRGDENKT